MDRIRPTRDAAAAPTGQVARLLESVRTYGVDGTLALLAIGHEADAQNRARRAVSTAMVALDRLHEARTGAQTHVRIAGRDPATDLGIPPEELDTPGAARGPLREAAPTSAGGRSVARDLGLAEHELVPLDRLREVTDVPDRSRARLLDELLAEEDDA
jgi:hypothetical protein